MRFAAFCICLPLAVTAFGAPLCTANATTWCEVQGGDAGHTIAGAEITSGGPMLTDIIGTLGDGTSGADLYEIMITNPAVFSATTEPVPAPGHNPDPDPALYLFDSTGHGVYAIDDISGEDTQATLQAGLGIGPQTPGIYYILIAPSGNLPEGPASNPLFSLVTGSDVAGDSHVLANFSDNGCGTGCKGSYDIHLTGASFATTPEPQTFALLGAGLLGIGTLRRRKNRRK